MLKSSETGKRLKQKERENFETNTKRERDKAAIQ